MNLAGAAAGIVAGVVVAVASYGWLNLVAAVVLAPLVVQLARPPRHPVSAGAPENPA
jgi:hypothetical protein